jgi:hypothetical protein
MVFPVGQFPSRHPVDLFHSNQHEEQNARTNNVAIKNGKTTTKLFYSGMAGRKIRLIGNKLFAIHTTMNALWAKSHEWIRSPTNH